MYKRNWVVLRHRNMHKQSMNHDKPSPIRSLPTERWRRVCVKGAIGTRFNLVRPPLSYPCALDKSNVRVDERNISGWSVVSDQDTCLFFTDLYVRT